MAKLKTLMASILCGISTISIMPTTDYSHYVPQSPNTITRSAWQKTGNSLRASITKVGKSIGAAKASEQEQQCTG